MLLHYKKKHRSIKITLLGGAVRTMLLDDSLSVMELVQVIGEKLALQYSEEYCLHALGVWLNPSLSLEENGVSCDDKTVELVWIYNYSSPFSTVLEECFVGFFFNLINYSYIFLLHSWSRSAGSTAMAKLTLLTISTSSRSLKRYAKSKIMLITYVDF